MRVESPLLRAAAKLRFIRYRFVLAAMQETRLPAYLGSTLRGGLAMAFKRMHCTHNLRPCDGCLTQRQCLYTTVFETPSATGEQAIKRLRDIPHPLVIDPPRFHPVHYKPGDRFAFDITLWGPALSKIPYFIFAVNEMAQSGLGAQRAPFRLEAVLDEEGQPVYHPETCQILAGGKPRALEEFFTPDAYGSHIRLSLATPLRIKADQTILSKALPPEKFLSHLLRRLSALITFYGGDSVSASEFQVFWHEQPRPVMVDSSLHWSSLKRYSNRQKSHISIGGLLGTMEFDEVSYDWWKVFQATTVFHAGKATVMGLGKIALHPLGS